MRQYINNLKYGKYLFKQKVFTFICYPPRPPFINKKYIIYILDMVIDGKFYNFFI